MIHRLLKYFERLIIFVLLVFMALVILFATIDLGRQIIQLIFSSPQFILGIDELLSVFGMVLLILIGVELVETIKAYFEEHVVHVEVVLEVALIAVARKVIILDIKSLSPETVLAIGVLIIALSIGFFLEKRGRTARNDSKQSGSPGEVV